MPSSLRTFPYLCSLGATLCWAYLSLAGTAGASQQEMPETKGKFGLPGATIGAVGSSAAYAGSVMTSGEQSSWAGFAEAASIGAAGGFLEVQLADGSEKPFSQAKWDSMQTW